MRGLRQLATGLGIGLISLVIALGGLSASLVESGVVVPTQVPPLTDTSTLPSSPLPPTRTPLPPTSTHTTIPSPTACMPPAGWISYLVQDGDTIEGLADLYNIPESALVEANCLTDAILLPGSILSVPSIPTPTPTQTSRPPQTQVTCGAPRGWVTYIVRQGDTLYRLSQAYGITVRQLQNANCMGNSTFLVIGQSLFVPNWATRTPSPTFYIVITDTPWIETWTPEPSFTPEDTPTPVPTETETPTVSP